MTTNEFIKQVEELGYTFECDDSFLNVYSKGTHFKVCVFSLEIDQQYSLHMRSGNFLYTANSKEEQEKLYNLAVEYDKTPVKEREEEKKYRLRLNLPFVEERSSYLNKDNEGNIFFSDKHFTSKEKTTFTASEVELLPQWVSHFIFENFLVQEEVK